MTCTCKTQEHHHFPCGHHYTMPATYASPPCPHSNCTIQRLHFVLPIPCQDCIDRTADPTLGAPRPPDEMRHLCGHMYDDEWFRGVDPRNVACPHCLERGWKNELLIDRRDRAAERTKGTGGGLGA